MSRKWVIEMIRETLSVEPDYPFPGDDESAVFRHTDTRKWFALLMHVPRRVLGLPGEASVDIVNVKCNPFISGSLREKPGILPAYHMNKSQWITILLDGTVERSAVQSLIEMSYDLTMRKIRGRCTSSGIEE